MIKFISKNKQKYTRGGELYSYYNLFVTSKYLILRISQKWALVISDHNWEIVEFYVIFM